MRHVPTQIPGENMNSTFRFARWLASLAVLLSATELVAQSRPSTITNSSRTTEGSNVEDISKCPVIGGAQRPASERTTASGGMSTEYWWPNQLNLKILHQNSSKSDPMGGGFIYADEFKKLDLAAAFRLDPMSNRLLERVAETVRRERIDHGAKGVGLVANCIRPGRRALPPLRARLPWRRGLRPLPDAAPRLRRHHRGARLRLSRRRAQHLR